MSKMTEIKRITAVKRRNSDPKTKAMIVLQGFNVGVDVGEAPGRLYSIIIGI